MTDTTDTDPTVQTTLPLELPDYHGRPATGMKISVSGAGKRITRPHTLGDRVVLVVEAKVKHAGHDDGEDGVLYVEKLNVVDLFELAGDPGRRLLSTMRSLYRSGEDAAAGREPLPGMTVHTDASGVVLTEAELAQLRGDPVSAITSPDLTPAVIVYNDDTRELWPDDFPRDTIRPSIGTTIDRDGITLEVVDLLHHETGESMVPAPAPAAVDDSDIEPGSEFDGPTTAAPASGELPDLPEPEAPPAEPADDWETPDPATAAREEAARLASLPNADDFSFVDRPVSTIIVELDQIADTVRLTRLLTAERQGRGKAAKPRARVEKAIGDRIAQLLDAEG